MDMVIDRADDIANLCEMKYTRDAYALSKTEAEKLQKRRNELSAEQAKEFAETEFEKYRVIQDRIFESDFDKFELPTLPFDNGF